MTEGFNPSVVMASILLLCMAVTIGLFWRRFRMVSVGLSGILLCTLTYSAMLIPSIETVLNERLMAATVLFKDLVLVVVMLCINILVKALRPHEKRVIAVVSWSVPMILVVWKMIIWLQLDNVCTNTSGFRAEECFLHRGSYVATEVVHQILLGVWGLSLAVVLLKNSEGKTPQGRAALMTGMAAVVAAIWSFTVAIGSIEVWQQGHLSSAQYALRPALSMLGAALLCLSILYVPFQAAVSRVALRKRLQPLLVHLEQKEPVLHAEMNNLTTDVMDTLGIALSRDTSRCLENDGSAVSAKVAARWLTGKEETPRGIPRDFPLFLQRHWLLRVAKEIRKESKV